MTASESTPRTGQESIDRETARELSDDELADAFEEASEDVAEASQAVAAALRGEEGRPLTDADLERVSEGANALLAYWYAGVQRVPEEHRIG